MDLLIKDNFSTKELAKLLSNYYLVNNDSDIKKLNRDINKLKNFFNIKKINGKYSLVENLSKNYSAKEHLTFRMFYPNDRIDDKKAFLDKIKQKDKTPIYIKIDIEEMQDRLKRVLEKSISNKYMVYFLYQDEYREVYPIKITLFEGFWYLIGMFDIDSDKLYRFRLRYIEDIEILDEYSVFDTPEWIENTLEESVNIWFRSNKEPFEIELLVKEEIIAYFEDKPISSTQRLLSIPNSDDKIMTLKITHYNEIIFIINRWLPNLIPLQPQELRDKVEKNIIEFLENMKNFTN